MKFKSLLVAVGFGAAALSAFAADITGAGATFPFPIYSKWAEAYKKETGVGLNYQSIGSSGGIRQIRAKTVSFGATDAPVSGADLDKDGMVQFPAIIGGTVPVINLDGFKPGELRITGTVLADIYLGVIKNWNDRVRPSDKVYHLGDVVINRRYLHVLDRLNGDKVLIKGNHDIFDLEDYYPRFRDIRGYHVLNGMILSHVPLHTDSLERFGCNIHGHLHANRVMRVKHVGATPEIDPRYYNVSVECIDFAPILLEDVMKRIQEQGGTVGFKERNGNAPVM